MAIPLKRARQRGERVLTEPSVRVSTQWTPQRIRTVQASADSGNMQPVADLCDQILRDERFGENFASLADAVLGSELTWERGLRLRRKDPTEVVPLSAEADNDWWETFSEATYSQIIAWRELLGFCFAKLTWLTSERTGRWVPSLEFWHPRHFRFDRDKRQWFVKTDEQGAEIEVHAGDGWVGFYRRSVTRPWADGIWRGLSRWWMSKAFAISDWNVHGEKALRVVVTSSEEVTAEDRKALAQDLYALGKDGVVVLPHGFVYQLVEAAATGALYEAQINAANMAGTVAILGQNLTTEISDQGSRAAAEVHERKESRKIRYIAESLATTLREQVMLAWATYNFGAADVAPWHVWQVDPPEDKAGEATVLSTLAGAITTLKAAGKAIPDDKLRDDFGVELEDLPPEPAPPAALGGPKPPAPKEPLA